MSTSLGGWDAPASPASASAAVDSPSASTTRIAKSRAPRTSSVDRILSQPNNSNNLNNMSTRPPPAALSMRPSAASSSGKQNQPISILNLQTIQMAESKTEESTTTDAATVSFSPLSGGSRVKRAKRASGLAASGGATASSGLAIAGSSPRAADAALPSPTAAAASAAAVRPSGAMKGSLRPSPPPAPVATAATAGGGGPQPSPTSPHVLSRVLSATSINAGAVPSTATSVSQSASTAPSTAAATNVIVSQNIKDRSAAAALNTHMIAQRARESNLASSLTGYLQNQLSLYSKRGHAREVLHILEERQQLVLNTPPSAAAAASSNKESTKKDAAASPLLLSATPSSSSGATRSSLDLLKPPTSASGASRPLSAVQAEEQRLFHAQLAAADPRSHPHSRALSRSHSQSGLPPATTAAAHDPPLSSRAQSRRGSTQLEVFAPLPVSRGGTDIACISPRAPAPASVAATTYPEGSSNPNLPPLPLAKLNLPSDHFLKSGGGRRKGGAVDALATKAAAQYATLATQAAYLSDLESKEDAFLRQSFRGSAADHASFVGVDTWNPPSYVRSIEDDGRDAWGRKFLAGLATDYEKRMRFDHIAQRRGDPVPNSTALQSLLHTYNQSIPRDYRSAVAAGSAGVGVGAERNAALDFESLKGRKQWGPILKLAKEEARNKERTALQQQQQQQPNSTAYASGSQSARAGRHSSGSVLPASQSQALRLRLPDEPPSQATAINPPMPAKSFRRNMRALAYRINDGLANSSGAMEHALSGSLSERAHYHGHADSSGSHHNASSAARAASHLSPAIDQHVHPGLYSHPPQLPSQPLVANIYSTTHSFLLPAAEISPSASSSAAGALGSFSATGGFQRVSNKNAFTAYTPATPNALSSEQQLAQQQALDLAAWRREMAEGTMQVLSTGGGGINSPADSRARPSKKDAVLVTIIEPPLSTPVAEDLSLASLLDFSDRNGSTSLFHASWEGYTSILSLLCEFGANVNARNVRQHSAMDMAVERGHADVVRILLRFGADSTRAEGSAARKRCRARLGNNYAQWVKRMKLGGWMTEACEILSNGNPKTGAPVPNDTESNHFTPLHNDLRNQDASILLLFEHTVFWPPIVRPDLDAMLLAPPSLVDPADQDPENWADAQPRRGASASPTQTFIPFQPPPLRHLTRESRLARVTKLREARLAEIKHKAEFRIAAGLAPASSPKQQKSALLSPKQLSGSSTVSTPTAAESKQNEESQSDEDQEPTSFESILTLLPRVRTQASSSSAAAAASDSVIVADKFEEGSSSSSIDAYESDLDAFSRTLAQRPPGFYVTNATAVLAMHTHRNEGYSPLERWSDELELYNAVLSGNLSAVESILKSHPEHAAFIGHGCSLLFHAAYHGFYSIARALLAAAAESKMEAAVIAAARRSSETDESTPDPSSVRTPDSVNPSFAFDLTPEGREKPAPDRRVSYFDPLFTGIHPPVGVVESSKLNATLPIGVELPRLLDVNYLCVDELRNVEEHRADDAMRSRFETLAEHRRLRRELAEKRAARIRIKALEKSSREALNISDSESSSEEEADQGGSGGGRIGKVHASATIPLTSSPKDAIVPSAADAARSSSSKQQAAQQKREAAERAQLATDAEIDSESALPLATQIWHRWIVDPRGWNRQKLRENHEKLVAARSEAVAIAVAAGKLGWEALDEDQRQVSYDARRMRDREQAEDAAIAAADAQAQSRRFHATQPQRWETAIYIALKRKHYRLALLLHSQGAISPYTRQELLQMCDVQLRAREIMQSIRAGSYTSLQSLLASASARPGLLAQVLSYQDASRGGNNPILLCIGSNDLRAMELVRNATTTQPGGTLLLNRLLAGIKDRLGYSAIDASLLSAACGGGGGGGAATGALGGSGLAGALAHTDASTSNSIAMTSFLLNLGGLTLSTNTILDLVLNKQTEGAEATGAAGVSVNYAGLEALKRIMVQTSLASAKSAVAASTESNSSLGGSRGRLVAPASFVAKDVIDFVALFAALDSNVHHLRPEQIADLRENLHAVEREHEFLKQQRQKAIAAAKAEASLRSNKRGSGSNKYASPASVARSLAAAAAASKLSPFPSLRRELDEDEMGSILEEAEQSEESPRRAGGATGNRASYSFDRISSVVGASGLDDSDMQEETVALQRAISHLDEEDARKLALAQAQKAKVEALKASLSAGVRITNRQNTVARAGMVSDSSSSSSDDDQDNTSKALSTSQRSAKRSAKRAARRSTANEVTAAAEAASAASATEGTTGDGPHSSISSRPQTGASAASVAASESTDGAHNKDSNSDSDSDDDGSIPDWTKEIHDDGDGASSANLTRQNSTSSRTAAAGDETSNASSLTNSISRTASSTLRIDGAGAASGAVGGKPPSILKAGTKPKKKSSGKLLFSSAFAPRPPVIEPLPPVESAAAAPPSVEGHPDLLPLDLKARLLWMLEDIQNADSVDPQLLGVGVAAPGPAKPLTALEIVATLQAMQFPTAEPILAAAPAASKLTLQRPGSSPRSSGSSASTLQVRGGRGGKHARNLSAAIPNSCYGNSGWSLSVITPNAASSTELVDTSAPVTPAPATLIDVTMLKWANLLRLNPFIAPLLGIDFPALPPRHRMQPPSEQELASSIVTMPVNWGSSQQQSGDDSTQSSVLQSRRASTESMSWQSASSNAPSVAPSPATAFRVAVGRGGPVMISPPYSPITASSSVINSAAPTPRMGVGRSVAAARKSGTLASSTRPLHAFETPDPALRTMTVDAWLESFQRLARSHQGGPEEGVVAVRNAFDEFDSVCRIAKEELARQKAHKEATVAAEALRQAAATASATTSQFRPHLHPSSAGGGGGITPQPQSFLASRLAMYKSQGGGKKREKNRGGESSAFDDPYGSSSEDESDGAEEHRLASAASREVALSSPTAAASKDDRDGDEDESDLGGGSRRRGGHASIFSFVPHLDPSASSNQTSTVVSAAQSPMSQTTFVTSPQHALMAAAAEKKSVRWRGSVGSDVSVASNSSAASSIDPAEAAQQQIRASMQRTAAGLVQERGLSGV